MFDGVRNIFKMTPGYNSTYHHRMGWVVGGGTCDFSENTAIFSGKFCLRGVATMQHYNLFIVTSCLSDDSL